MQGSVIYCTVFERVLKYESKKQHRDRGYGLVRIDTIIERYQGCIRRGSEDGAFTTEVLLPQ